MNVDFFCPRWGSESIRSGTFSRRLKEDGFDGVEVFPLGDAPKNKDMLLSLADAGLEYILLHAELKEDGRHFGRYLDALERNLYTLLVYQGAQQQPRYIVSQTGREYFTMEQMEQCFALCDRIAQESGIPILQETHRNKWSYAAHVVHEYLLRYPSIRLALDLSHWVCVSESFLEDQQEAVDLAIRHADHVHARVGNTQGPQVTDPRAAEHSEALHQHLAWWDRWIERLTKEGKEVATITPEFGPHPYMSYIPHSKTPIVDQYELNCWMMQMLKKRYTLTT